MKKIYLVVSVLLAGIAVSSFGENIEFVGSYDNLTDAYDVDVIWPYAYICEYLSSSGLVILDISDPTNPVFVSSYTTPGRTHDIDVENGYAYLADDIGLHIVDVSIPEDPIYVSQYDTDGRAFGIFAYGDLVFVACGSDGLLIFDVSNPSVPDLIGSCYIPYCASGVYAIGNIAYIAAHDFTLYTVDISIPSNPIILAMIDTPGYARRGVYLRGNYAFVPDWGAGLQIIDITDPSNPIHIGNYNSPGYSLNVYVKDCAYFTDFGSGVFVLDINEPSNPILLASYNTPGTARGLDVVSGYIFIADVSSLQILRLITTGIDTDAELRPDSYILIQNYPNPFNSSTIIQYSLSDETYVTVNIYDLLGRNIETLVSQQQTAGSYQIAWNADHVPSGIYFYKIQTSDFSSTKKMILMK